MLGTRYDQRGLKTEQSWVAAGSKAGCQTMWFIEPELSSWISTFGETDDVKTLEREHPLLLPRKGLAAASCRAGLLVRGGFFRALIYGFPFEGSILRRSESFGVFFFFRLGGSRLLGGAASSPLREPLALLRGERLGVEPGLRVARRAAAARLRGARERGRGRR